MTYSHGRTQEVLVDQTRIYKYDLLGRLCFNSLDNPAIEAGWQSNRTRQFDCTAFLIGGPSLDLCFYAHFWFVACRREALLCEHQAYDFRFGPLSAPNHDNIGKKQYIEEALISWLPCAIVLELKLLDSGWFILYSIGDKPFTTML